MFRTACFLRPPLFHEQTTGTTPAAPAPPAVSPALATPERRADALIERLTMTHGSLEAALRAMALRAITAEDAQATAEVGLRSYRDRLPEGAVVISKDEAAQIAKLKALGTVDEIVAKVKRAGELEETTSAQALGQLARTAAPEAGLDPEAFVVYAQREKLPIEMRDATIREGQKLTTKKVPYVRKPGDDRAAWEPLADYVGKLPAFDQRALKAAGAATTLAPEQTVVTGLPYPKTGTTTPAGPRDYVAEHIQKTQQQNANKVNPLFPQSPRPVTPQAS